MGFFDRNRSELAEKGIDPERLPPGQYHTDRFPVLHVGDVPTYGPGVWDMKIFGLVDNPFTLNEAELRALPKVDLLTDIHCVTKWSKFDTTWTGVRVSDLFDRAGVKPEATHVLGHAEFGYSANLPLADLVRPESMVVYAFEGEDIEPIHGGPVRLLVPHLYFWKSPKWLRGLELIPADRPGFWERNGYNMYGDPFKEQRYWGE